MRGTPDPAPDEPRWEQWRRRVPGAPADLRVYLVDASAVTEWALAHRGCLSEDEAGRAGRLLDDRRRESFVVSHVILRHVLARQLGCSPRSVPVLRGPGGSPVPLVHTSGTGVPPEAREPSLLETPVRPETPARSTTPGALTFSLSRTRGYVAVATAHRPVGVDVEQLQSPAQADALLTLLHPEDVTRVRNLRPRRRARAVTDAWVRIEALLKGRRVGLTEDPARVRVGERRRARHPDDWWVTGVRARRGVRLAVAWRTSNSKR